MHTLPTSANVVPVAEQVVAAAVATVHAVPARWHAAMGADGAIDGGVGGVATGKIVATFVGRRTGTLERRAAQAGASAVSVAGQVAVALVVGVLPGRNVRTRPQRAYQVATPANIAAGAVAAHSVHAKAAQTLGVERTVLAQAPFVDVPSQSLSRPSQTSAVGMQVIVH